MKKLAIAFLALALSFAPGCAVKKKSSVYFFLLKTSLILAIRTLIEPSPFST